MGGVQVGYGEGLLVGGGSGKLLSDSGKESRRWLRLCSNGEKNCRPIDWWKEHSEEQAKMSSVAHSPAEEENAICCFVPIVWM